MSISIFERYPQLETLRGLVLDQVVEEQVGSQADEFERNLELANLRIPTVNLNKVFPVELEKGSIALENFLGHWGNASIEDLCKICLMVKFLKPKKILEIGTYNGMTTLQMALNAPSECITYTLDLPEETQASLQHTTFDDYVAKHFRKKFGTTTGSYFKKRVDLNIKQLWGDSAIFDYSVVGDKIDIIFIDAAHDYKNKSIDTENALRLLATNGLIIWHNYNDVLNPEVTKYLLDISGRFPIYHLRNTMTAIYWNRL